MDTLALEYRGFSFAYATEALRGAAPSGSRPGRSGAKGANAKRGDAVAEGERAARNTGADASQGAPWVIGPVDWGVQEGAFVLVVGATGSGKTTLLKSAKPEIAPVGERAGDVLAFGAPVESLGVERSARTVGYVAQSPDSQLACSTVWHQMAFGLENLGVSQAEMRRRVAEVAHFFNIEPWFEHDVNELSGGQKQLLNLASVLVMRPRLLLLDEPTAQLDPVAEKNFLHALFRLNRELGMTIVMVTHAPEAAADYATEAACLQDGIVRPVPLGDFRADALIVPCGEAVFDAHDGEARATRAKRSGAMSEVVAASKYREDADGARGDGRKARAAELSAADGPGGDPAVELRDVYVRYAKGSPWVLRGTDLEVATGTVHVLLGGNGCGKSTLLDVVAGTLKSERGQVRCTLRDEVGFLPQDPHALFVCDTVADELREWQRTCGYADGEVDAALSRLGLARHASHHPYDLSEGQQQLLAFAKLLLASPRLLLLDEPTKGLDPVCKLAVAHLLETFRAQGGTVVVATHDLAFAAAVADEVSLLFDGQVTCSEPVSDFFRDNLFYRPVADAFWRLWADGRASAPCESGCREGEAPRSASTGSPKAESDHDGVGAL